MKYIKRLIEGILKDRFENSKSVLVLGNRQVGKSTLLTHLYSNIDRKKSRILQKRDFLSMIKRDKYLKLLISASNNGFPKVITGIRRCGKSYLLLANFSYSTKI